MRASWDSLLVLIFAGWVAAAGSSGADSAHRAAPAEEIDRLMLASSRPEDPGFAVLVKQGARTLLLKGYGVREFGKPGKIEPDTNFRLASVTKQFTAMAIMLLVKDGKLHYDDHLTDLWPDFPPYGRSITVRELLTHTSGLRDYEDLMEAEGNAHGTKWSAKRQITDAEVLALLKGQTSGVFPPGTKWEYSNSGYVVLGLIVAKASGTSYAEFLQKRIFSPLRMKTTLVYVKNTNDVVNRAYGHTKEGDRFTVTDQSSTSGTQGDGGIYSNVLDLAKWDEALTNHTLLGEGEMAVAWTPAKTEDGTPYYGPKNKNQDEQRVIEYGFGWFLDPYKGHRREYHDGESVGFRSTNERYFKDHLTIIILSNRTDTRPRELAEKMAGIVFAAK